MNSHGPLKHKIELVWTAKIRDRICEDTGDFSSSSRRIDFDFAKASVYVSFRSQAIERPFTHTTASRKAEHTSNRREA